MKNGKMGVLEYNEKQREINKRLDKTLEELDYNKYKDLNEYYIKKINNLEKELPELEGEEQQNIENYINELKEHVIELSGEK